MAVLLRKTEVWRADTEKEAQFLISEATKENGILTKKVVEVKTKKAKGEIIDENLRVTIQVDYAEQFEPVEIDSYQDEEEDE